ncbi:MAG TPA: LON peptidase substrate-binding domain-containing protein, partial [Leptospiraceae bacterium]|nr:LON peptidase substrate-binding domain-containing protein [Leptospiraceae bacterium]
MKKSINHKKKNKSRKKAFSYEEEKLPEILPILPIKSRPIFPGIITPVMISAGRLTQTVEDAYNKEGFVGLSLIREEDEEKEITENIYSVGIAAKILKKLNMPDGSVNILVNTIHRFRIEKFSSTDPIIKAKVEYPVDFSDDKNKPKNYLKGLIRTILMYAKDLSSNNPMFTEDMKMTLVNISEPGKIADFVGSVLNLEKNEYQEIIESLEIHDRLEKVLLFTRKELELLDVQRKINDQVNQKMDRNQRQYFLREQLKAIQGELGLGEDKSEKKFTSLEERLIKARVPEEVLAEVKRELEKLNFIEPHSAEYQVLRNYLDMIEALPWEEPPVRNVNLKKSR